jgi:ureidoglycolate lyase
MRPPRPTLCPGPIVATELEPDIEIRTIRAETLTREAFAPFGDVLSDEGLERLPIDFYGERFDFFRAGDFESDQPVEWLISRGRIREFRILFLERHLELTQTFIPLAGHPFVLAVAAPDALEEDGIPALHAIHAFLVPGDRAVNLHRRTWHEPPFPLVDGALCLYTSHKSLTRGLTGGLDARGEVDLLDVEKRNITERAGFVLRIELP